MNSIHISIMIIACLVSIATSLPGLFLVLYDSALMSDAISHAILPGIVVMFLWVGNLDSPLLLLGAALAGLLTVISTQLIIQTNRIKKDAAIGLIFPLFFSIGVILITLFAKNVHLDVDMVLLGELAFAPFNQLSFMGYHLGPSAIWVVGIIVVIVSIMVYLLYKELVIATFDKEYATVLRIRPAVMYYLLMALTSVVAVSAFDSVGSVVTVALMITPAATAFILVKELDHMIAITMLTAISSALMGYSVAALCDVSIAGAIALMNGIIFMIAFVFGYRGVIAYYRHHIHVREQYALDIVKAVLRSESHTLISLAKTLGWHEQYVMKIVQKGVEKGALSYRENHLIIIL